MRIIHLQLESQKERYSATTNDAINFAITAKGHDLKIIERPKLTEEIKSGKVLDANSTIWGQSVQMRNLAEMFDRGEILNGDVFFVSDFWMHNIASLRYMAMLNGIQIYIFGWAHAGSYTDGDFMQPGIAWGANIMELAFCRIYDGIFMGSQYHKDKFLSSIVPDAFRKEIANKIFVTGNVMDTSLLPFAKWADKENLVIWPHRFHQEKDPGLMIDIMDDFLDINKDWKLMVCNSSSGAEDIDFLGRKLNRLCNRHAPRVETALVNKGTYHSLLAKAKIFLSTTMEENFGYCLTESMAAGCFPIVPNNFSHIEILNRDSRCLYDTIDEAIEKMINISLMDSFDNSYFRGLVSRYDKSAGSMISVIEHVVAGNHQDAHTICKNNLISWAGTPRYNEPLLGGRV